MPTPVYTGAQISIGNGVTTVFPYGWKILDQTHIEVKVDGVVKTIGADYTVSGVGNSSGGNVTFLAAPANLAVVQRARKVPYKRDTDYQTNGDLKEDTLDTDLDLEEMQIQQLAADIARAFKAPLSVTADQVLTDAMWAARASMMLGFDGAGALGVFAALNPANPASAYILTLLDDADAATAANTLAVIAKAIGTAKGDLIGFSAAGVPVRKAVGTDGQALAADSTQASGLAYVDNPARPNLLVNPNWQIDQINEGALYTINGAAANGPDGWSGEAIGGGGGVFKLRTLADPDNAALKCLEITCTTVDAVIAAAERYSIYSAVEGYDAASLMAGTAAAQSVTLQFKFKTSVAGTYGVSIANSAKNRAYVGAIVVADALEHEYSLVVPMDVAGAWLYTNGVGLYLRLTLAGGANFAAAPGAWAAADNYVSNVAQANFMSNVANIAYLKRIQLIPGGLVQAYRPADIQKELAKAQRQYCKTYDQGTIAGTVTTNGQLLNVAGTAAGKATFSFQFPSEMRAAPTVVLYSPATGTAAKYRDVTSATDFAATTQGIGTRMASISDNAAGATAAGDYVSVQATASARLS